MIRFENVSKSFVINKKEIKVLDEINLYVKDTYKLKSPTRINYNDTDAEDITEPPEDVAEEAVIVSELREEIENSISKNSKGNYEFKKCEKKELFSIAKV